MLTAYAVTPEVVAFVVSPFKTVWNTMIYYVLNALPSGCAYIVNGIALTQWL
jgi:hypothetical protein